MTGVHANASFCGTGFHAGRQRILYLTAKAFDARTREAESTGIRRYASARGWEVCLAALDERRPGPVLNAALHRLRPLGCIVKSGGCLNPPPRLFGATPVVYVEPSCGLCRLEVPRVVMDNAEIARFAFRELMSGHPEALAFVGSRWNRIWSRERGWAFAALVHEANLPFFPFPYRRETDEERIARLRAFVRLLPPRCGVFCATDRTAADVSRFAVEERRHVPRDLAFVGVNDIESLWTSPSPSVTSVRLDFERFGYEAAKMLAHRIDAGGADIPPAVALGPLMVTRRDSTRGRGRRSPNIVRAVEMIRAEACDGLTAVALASRFPGSRRLFDLRFREAMGHPVYDEILHVRLERALSLLARPDVPIEAIAFQCGFGSQIALHKLFRGRYGISMSQWRKNHSR